MRYRVKLQSGAGFWFDLDPDLPDNTPMMALLDDSSGWAKYTRLWIGDTDRDPEQAARMIRNQFYDPGNAQHEVVSVAESRIRLPQGRKEIEILDEVDYGEVLGRPFFAAALILEYRAEDVCTGPIVLRTGEIDSTRGETPAGEAWKAQTIRIEARRPAGAECMPGRDQIDKIISDLRWRVEAWWELDTGAPDWTRAAEEFRAWFSGLEWTDGRRRHELHGIAEPEDYSLACEELVAGDIVRWGEDVVADGGDPGQPIGRRTIEGEVLDCTIGRDVGDDELVIRIDHAEGFQRPARDEVIRRRFGDLREECRRADVDRGAREAAVAAGHSVREAMREAVGD